MALIYRAQLSPTKLELLRDWLPGQPWWDGPADAIELVGAYRFDDPAGAVGVETHLVRAGDSLRQAPVTYRSAPLAAAEAGLIGTTEHSELGRRWVYDGCLDPVYVATLAAVITAGGQQAREEVLTDNGRQEREPTVRVVGGGAAGRDLPAFTDLAVADTAAGTAIDAGPLRLVVRRVLDQPVRPAADDQTLTGTWAGQADPIVLATARSAAG